MFHLFAAIVGIKSHKSIYLSQNKSYDILLMDFRLEAYLTSGLILLQLGEGDGVSLNVPQCGLAGSSLSSSWTTFPLYSSKSPTSLICFLGNISLILKLGLLLKENHSLLQTFKSTNKRGLSEHIILMHLINTQGTSQGAPPVHLGFGLGWIKGLHF